MCDLSFRGSAMPVSVCYEAATFQRFLEGQLTVGEMESVASHLEECDQCAGIVKALPEDGIVAMVRAAQSLPAHSEDSHRIEAVIQQVLTQRAGAGTVD